MICFVYFYFITNFCPFNSIAFVCFVGIVDAEMETVLGEMEVELDGRFSAVRSSETNLGGNSSSFIFMYSKYI